MKGYIVVCVEKGMIEKALLCDTLDQAQVVAGEEAKVYDNPDECSVAIFESDSATLECQIVEALV